MYTVDIHVHEYVCENSVCSSSVIILLVTTPTGMESGQPSSGMEQGQEENGTDTNTEPLSPVLAKLASEWVPLELNFGIPLFNESTNSAVCSRVSFTVSAFGYG